MEDLIKRMDFLSLGMLIVLISVMLFINTLISAGYLGSVSDCEDKSSIATINWVNLCSSVFLFVFGVVLSTKPDSISETVKSIIAIMLGLFLLIIGIVQKTHVSSLGSNADTKTTSTLSNLSYTSIVVGIVLFLSGVSIIYIRREPAKKQESKPVGVDMGVGADIGGYDDFEKYHKDRMVELDAQIKKAKDSGRADVVEELQLDKQLEDETYRNDKIAAKASKKAEIEEKRRSSRELAKNPKRAQIGGGGGVGLFGK